MKILVFEWISAELVTFNFVGILDIINLLTEIYIFSFQL